MISFTEVFLRKAIIHLVLLNVFLRYYRCLLCQCLFIASLALGNERLYVTEKGFMPVQIRLEVLKSDLFLKLSTLLIWLWMLAFLLPFPQNVLIELVHVFCLFRFLNIFFLFSVLHYKQGLFKRVWTCGFCVQVVLAINYFFSFFWFVKFLKFLNFTSDLVHIFDQRIDVFNKLWHEYAGIWGKDSSHVAVVFELKLP